MLTTVEILRRVSESIHDAEHWYRGAGTASSSLVRKNKLQCVDIALHNTRFNSAGEDVVSGETLFQAHQAILAECELTPTRFPMGCGLLQEWNDDPRLSFEDSQLTLKRAIARLETPETEERS